MEKEYCYMNAGIPIEGLLEPSPMQPWNSFSLPQEFNSSCFLNPNWDKPNDHFTQFQSTLTSVVSSSAHPTSSSPLNDFVGIRELIAKSGPISNSGKNPLPILNEFGKENLPNFSTDPEFAKRAAMFSCFGSHSFTARRSYSVLSDAESTHRSMARVWSSPSLKQADGSPNENTNSLKIQMEINNLNRFPSIDPNSNESSSISEQVLSGETMSKVANEIHTTRKRKAVPKSKAKENVSSTVDCHKDGEADDAKNGKRARIEEAKPSTKGGVNRHWKEEEDDEKVTDTYSAALDEHHKPEKVTGKPTEPPKDYIHVRARRGQATDSHSLAERVRREKIGERMKFLQDLVPGCNKVTGKALMLDEIINYVQSLQCQVEFLSMKLASVDPRKEVDMDNFTSKDIMRRNGSLSNSLYPVDSSGLYSHQANQYLPVHGNASLSKSLMEPVHKTSSNNLELQLPSLNEFVHCLPQFPAFFGEDLQSIVGMGFGQADMKEAVAFHSMSFPVGNQLQRSP